MSTTSIEYGFSQAPSLKLIFAYVERIAKAYHSAAAEFSGYGESMWAAFSEKQATVMDAIRGNNIAALRQQLISSGATMTYYKPLLEPGIRNRISNYRLRQINCMPSWYR
jgi:hypothetical protein